MRLNKKNEQEFDDELEEEPLEQGPEAEEEYDDYYDDLTDDFYDEGRPPIEKHSDLLKSLTNFDPYLKDCFNNWLGLTWNEEEGKFVQNPAIEPIMTIKGAAWCAGLQRTYNRSNNIITDIREEEFKNMLSDHIETIWLNLGTREDLGIKEDGDLLRVANEMEHSAALALMGAGDGKYKKFLGTTVSRHETINPNQNQPQGNMGYMMPQRVGMGGRLRRIILGR